MKQPFDFEPEPSIWWKIIWWGLAIGYVALILTTAYMAGRYWTW